MIMRMILIEKYYDDNDNDNDHDNENENAITN